MKHTAHIYSRGYVLLFVLVVSSIIAVVTIGFLNYYASAVRYGRVAFASAQALALAEAGIDTAVYSLNQDGTYTGESDTALDTGTFTVMVESLSGNTKRIVATGSVPNNIQPIATKIIQVTASIDSSIVAFHYGIQSGQGGIDMSNFARVVGNVYSNGNIFGENSARIQGTVVAAGANGIIEGMDIDGDSWARTIRGGATVGGNAKHLQLMNTNVSGNVEADSISDCSIGGTARYDTRSSCTVTGAVTTPNPNPFVSPPILPLPVSDAQIDLWQAEAEAGGTIGSQNFSSGSRSLGPIKISGDLTITNSAEVVVTGTIWVTGTINLNNSATLRLDGSYGGSSGVVMAGVEGSATAGYIDLASGVHIRGSGFTGSNLMLLSLKEMGSNAIRVPGTTVAILYAGKGQIEISGSAALKEVTANKLIIDNNAVVTYESGLQNVGFVNGPGGSWGVVPGSYAITK